MSEPIIRVDNVHKSYLMGKEAAPPCEASRWRSTLAALSASWWPAARARPLLNIIGGLGDPIEATVTCIGLEPGATVGDVATVPITLTLSVADLGLQPGLTGRVELHTRD